MMTTEYGNLIKKVTTYSEKERLLKKNWKVLNDESPKKKGVKKAVKRNGKK